MGQEVINLARYSCSFHFLLFSTQWYQESQRQSLQMNPKRYMELSDGHHIPVLGFGTFVPGEVRMVLLEFRRKPMGPSPLYVINFVTEFSEFFIDPR